MTQDVAWAPPRYANHDILEEKWAKDDHTTDLLSVCQRITMIVRYVIERGTLQKASLIWTAYRPSYSMHKILWGTGDDRGEAGG